MDYQEAIEIIEYASAFNSENSRLTKALNTAISAMQELQEYKKIGTPEGVRDAVEKQRAKRAKIKMLSRDIEYWCPNCRESHIVMHSKKGLDYCYHCGQKLDWSNKDDR